MSQQQRREIYADWWYDVCHRTTGADNALRSLDSDATDLDDFVEMTSTMLSFAPNPTAWGDKAIHDPRTTDPYSYAINLCRTHLSGIIQFHSEGMSEGELKNLVAIEEFIRQTDNA